MRPDDVKVVVEVGTSVTILPLTDVGDSEGSCKISRSSLSLSSSVPVIISEELGDLDGLCVKTKIWSSVKMSSVSFPGGNADGGT